MKTKEFLKRYAPPLAVGAIALSACNQPPAISKFSVDCVNGPTDSVTVIQTDQKQEFTLDNMEIRVLDNNVVRIEDQTGGVLLIDMGKGSANVSRKIGTTSSSFTSFDEDGTKSKAIIASHQYSFDPKSKDGQVIFQAFVRKSKNQLVVSEKCFQPEQRIK